LKKDLKSGVTLGFVWDMKRLALFKFKEKTYGF
jgi:hypothetical protein